MLSKLSLEQHFKLCFNKLPNPPKEPINQIISAFNFNIPEFERLLIKTDLEPYKEILWLFGLKEIYVKNIYEFQKQNSKTNTEFDFERFADFLDHVVKYKPELVTVDENGGSCFDFNPQDKKREELELTESLYFLLLEQSKGINLNFKSQVTKNKFNSSSDFMVNTIINALIAEYDKRNYNEINLSFEDAEWELSNRFDMFWIREYLERIEGVVKSDTDDDIYHVDWLEDPVDIYDIEVFIDEHMIKEYADDHYKRTDITLEFITDKYKELKAKHKPKVGAKAKNDHIASVAERLSYLIRLKQFLEQDEYGDISQYPISNNDCRLIHEYLDFWGLIENKETSNTTAPHNYIRALIKNYRKHRKLINERNMSHFHINSFKRNGEYPIK